MKKHLDITPLIVVFFLFACKHKIHEDTSVQHAVKESNQEMPSAQQVLDRLKSGNKSFLQMISTRNTNHGSFYNYYDQVNQSKEQQHPVAFVLTCMDSRVIPEIIFDQGIGQLFIDRVAGNVEDQFILGSMEYAVNVQGVKLIIVLGHTHCGAIHAAFGHLDSSNQELVPLIDHVKQGIIPGDKEPYDASAKHNVVKTITDILSSSKAIRMKVDAHEVDIVGGLYHVDNGIVEWNDKNW